MFIGGIRRGTLLLGITIGCLSCVPVEPLRSPPQALTLWEQIRSAESAGNFDEAEQLIEQQLNSNPDPDEHAKLELEYIYLENLRGRYDTGLERVERFRKTFNQFAYKDYLLYLEGTLMLRKGGFELAEAASKHLKVRKEHPALMRLHRAMDLFAQLAEFFPNSVYEKYMPRLLQEAKNQIGRYYLRVAQKQLERKRYQHVIGTSKELVRLYPNFEDSVYALDMMAKAYSALGQSQKATAVRRQMLERFPEHSLVTESQ